ncbi:Pre-mRNA-splicing factor cef1 [Coemansia biformis]|uniref:Pre-mRNA-splicing factor cef1 n=1 Tax=Coemansia biformis TaxID=1286918 RepID=A0A9W7YGB0_9FUNG|nr:Pre-mRNA-splicing factor cef1 [Coemansia biformis]
MEHAVAGSCSFCSVYSWLTECRVRLCTIPTLRNMRVHLKGGVWKNTEDEILKAAVMKYGKTQWARISSLLVRKTPKQCKARWYEWLDPSIKKTEWSREEDEKLLHMAKLMPTQWRTIAPIVGRAPAQCLERYQRLLDEAEARAAGEDDGLGLQGEVGAEGRATASDARRLRPGEIDPHPETKPARPDPVDMDEDEKDMLSEARARLANTQGKKAKRKARERQLEEARRLATLQKRRELKAAGVELKVKKKKDKHHMDYNMEIPYERKPMPGFYDTTDELARKDNSVAMLKGRFLDSLEGKSRADREEDSRMEAKRKRDKKSKDAVAFVRASDQKSAEAAAARDEAEQAAKRSKLVLPTPQVDDAELATIAKLGQQGVLARGLVAAEGAGGSTDGLLGDYSETPSVTAVRTPRVPVQSDRIMNEALAQRAMASLSTPLLGGEGASSSHGAQRGLGTGFGGARPQSGAMATPNPLATPLRAEPPVAASAGAAAVRDQLGLNTPVPGTDMTPRERKLAARGLREQLGRRLAAIPQPKNEFEIVVPEPDAGGAAEAAATADGVAALKIGQAELGSTVDVEDQADIDRRLEAERRQAAELELERRSQSVKRGLPRPDVLTGNMLAVAGDASIPDPVLKMVSDEMRALIPHDARVHPVPNVPPLRPSQPFDATLEAISDDMLAAARALVDKEAAAMRQEIQGAYRQLADAAGDELWRAAEDAETWLPQAQAYVPTREVGAEDWIEKHRRELAARRKVMAEEAARATKIERKLGVTLGGYQARSKALGDKIHAAYKEYEQARLDMEAFGRLYTSEQATIPARLEKAEAEARKAEARESLLQSEYRALLERRDQLAAQLASGPRPQA